jgi:hypothetical protein
MLEPDFDPVPDGCSDRAMQLPGAVPSTTMCVHRPTISSQRPIPPLGPESLLADL